MTINYRDGRKHKIGPLTLQHLGAGEHGPYGIAELTSRKGTVYGLDWFMGEAIAFCIGPVADLWNASESDREEQPGSGDFRGWLRLNLTQARAKLAPFQGVLPPTTRRRIFPVARLVTNAMAGERPISTSGERSADYRAEALTKEPSPGLKQNTREALIDLCARLARHRHQDLPANWAEQARSHFAAADAALSCCRF